MNESFNVRSKVISVNVTRAIAVLVCVASVVIYFLIDTEGMERSDKKFIIFLMLIPGYMTYWIYKSLFKHLVIKPFAKSFDHQMEYEGKGRLDIDQIRDLGIFGQYEGEDGFWKSLKGSNYSFKAVSEDKFIGEVSNRPFSLEEIKVNKVIGSGKHESEETVLMSYMIELGTYSHSGCTLLAYRNNAENVIALDSLELRRVPNIFNELNGWHFLSDKPVECSDYMRQSKLDDILNKISDIAQESLEEEDLILYITDDTIRLFIPSQKDRFESPVIGWISSDKIEKFYTELQGMVNMVDILETWEKDKSYNVANY